MRLEFRLKGEEKVRSITGSADQLRDFALIQGIVVPVHRFPPKNGEAYTAEEYREFALAKEAEALACTADWHQFVGTYEPSTIGR